ncbi:hypothetical protein PO883_27070 [Massilia sp. DJPM01]|uniref:hypothetical protein n=1 Tax=Massilia sp. DJPM01 TaxID=3024404 RepID=UPI00259D3A87|nr:hypothetical protein [Massilia sp. DJPM01]MDM5180849.1 hypothetical protein [Massilia sp. DJPM01]
METMMPDPQHDYKTSMYQVRPVITMDETHAIKIDYTYYDEAGTKIAAPTAQHMRAEFQNGNGDFVGFKMWKKRPGSEEQDIPAPADAGKPVHVATLYAAVAKTLSDARQVPNFMLANEKGELIIPIYKGTRRGVILIFQIFENGKFIKLAASPDPEIGNSTDGH